MFHANQDKDLQSDARLENSPRFGPNDKNNSTARGRRPSWRTASPLDTPRTNLSNPFTSSSAHHPDTANTSIDTPERLFGDKPYRTSNAVMDSIFEDFTTPSTFPQRLSLIGKAHSDPLMARENSQVPRNIGVSSSHSKPRESLSWRRTETSIEQGDESVLAGLDTMSLLDEKPPSNPILDSIFEELTTPPTYSGHMSFLDVHRDTTSSRTRQQMVITSTPIASQSNSPRVRQSALKPSSPSVATADFLTSPISKPRTLFEIRANPTTSPAITNHRRPVQFTPFALQAQNARNTPPSGESRHPSRSNPFYTPTRTAESSPEAEWSPSSPINRQRSTSERTRLQLRTLKKSDSEGPETSPPRRRTANTASSRQARYENMMQRIKASITEGDFSYATVTPRQLSLSAKHYASTTLHINNNHPQEAVQYDVLYDERVVDVSPPSGSINPKDTMALKVTKLAALDATASTQLIVILNRLVICTVDVALSSEPQLSFLLSPRPKRRFSPTRAPLYANVKDVGPLQYPPSSLTTCQYSYLLPKTYKAKAFTFPPRRQVY